MTRESLTTEQHVIRAAMLFLMLALLLKALSIPLSPVHWDSNYYLNIGSNFIERGELTPYMWRLGADTTIIAGSGTGYGVLLLTYWLKIFGLSLYSGYIFMYLVGIIGLVALYFLVREWWQNWQAGVVAIVFMAMSDSFFNQFYVRMDALAVLTYSLVLWLHVYAVNHQRKWLHFFVGVAVIAGAEVHIQILLYIVAISFYYMIEQVQFMWRERRFFALTPSIYYFTGAFIAGVIYLLIHVIPDPEAYFIIARDCPACDSAGIIKEIQRYVLYLYYRPAESLLFSIALGVAFVRRTSADRHFFILLLGYLIGHAAISPPPQVEYMSHMMPIFSLGVGAVFITSDDLRKLITHKQLVIGIFVASVLVISHLVILFIKTASIAPEQSASSIAYVREHISTDTTIMSIPPTYYHFLDYPNFLSYASGEEYGITLRGEDYPTFWERERPQVFIGQPFLDDDAWWAYMADHHFKRVRPDVWVAGDLYEDLIADQSPPQVEFLTSQTDDETDICAMLSWTVQNAESVNLNGQSVSADGSREVCPHVSSRYTLAAYWVGGFVEATIDIEVDTFNP